MRYRCRPLAVVLLLLCTSALPSDATTAKAIYAANYRAVVDITTFDTQRSVLAGGSGFVVGDGKLVVTCAHVIKDADAIVISFADGRAQATARVAAVDRAADVAVLALDTAYAYRVQFAQSKLVTGMDVFTIGSPLGLGSSIASGIISAIRKLPDSLTYIQTTAPSSATSAPRPQSNKRAVDWNETSGCIFGEHAGGAV